LSEVLARGWFNRPSAFKSFDRRIRGLLAEPLLAASLAAGDGESAFRWCGLGAGFGMQELKALHDLGVEPSTRVDPSFGTLLHTAATMGNVIGIRGLVGCAADLEAKDNVARKSKNKGDTPLIAAAIAGQVQAVHELLRHGALLEAVNDFGNTALMRASQYGNVQTLTVLMDHGAVLEKKDKFGSTALTQAAVNGQCGAAEMLILHRAMLEAKANNGFTPLLRAAAMGQCEVLEVLLKHGAVLEARTDDGATALIVGAALEVVNFSGSTALMEASRKGNCVIAETLIRYGATSKHTA